MVGKPKSKGSTKSSEELSSSKRNKSPGRTARSPARTKSPTRTNKSPPRTNKSPPRSPARTKSPGRSPARTSPSRIKPEATKTKAVSPIRVIHRTKSPARPKNASPATSTPILTPSRRSPIRRSPARTTKEIFEDKEKELLSVRAKQSKQKISADTDTDSDNAENVPEVKEKPKAAVRGRTRRTDVEVESGDKIQTDIKLSKSTDDLNPLGLVRRFTRSSQNREVERVVHLKHFDSISVTKKLGEFSDDDELLAKKSQAELQEFASPKSASEFGGIYGALFFTIAIPSSVVALHIVCNESKCSFTQLPDLKKYKLLSTFFDAQSFLGLFAYITLLAILSALPFGGPKVSALPNKHGKFEYVMNGFFSFCLISLIGCGLSFYRISIFDYIPNHIFHLLIASIAVGIFLSLYVYIRSFYVPISALNTHIVGKHGIYSFFMGREVNPRIFSILDLKMLFYRVLLIGAALVDIAYFTKSLGGMDNSENDQLTKLKELALKTNPTLLVYLIFHLLYCLDGLIFESQKVTSFGVQQEGFGYMSLIFCSVYPFMTATVIRHIVSHEVKLEYWKLALTSLLFSVGYFYYRGSNKWKDRFRKNPYSPEVARFETIPTTQGKKLIASGFWGTVRHPNYMGEVLIHLSFLPFVVCSPPEFTIFAVILILIHRAIRDNARCKQKYGAAWDRYCNRVKYMLVPKVF